MTTSAHPAPRTAVDGQPVQHHMSSETKASSKTTELYVYVAAVLAVVITALVVGEENNNGVDPFGALQAIQYITYLSIGYMIARGLAKSGSRDNHHN